jgi:hypothetical protein
VLVYERVGNADDPTAPFMDPLGKCAFDVRRVTPSCKDNGYAKRSRRRPR